MKRALKGMIDRSSEIVQASRFIMGAYLPKVIVLGHQKSGTSAIAHLLAECCGFSSSIDIPDFWGLKLVKALRDKRSLNSIVWRNIRPFSKELVKEPNLTLFSGEVVRKFKRSGIVFVTRHPMDNIRSFLDRCGVTGENMPVSSLVSRLDEHWAPVFFASELKFGQETTVVGTLAERWVRFNKGYIEHHDRMELLRYEDFVRNKARTIRDLAEKLGFDQVKEFESNVNRQFQPKGANRDSTIEFFDESARSVIQRICGNTARTLGYEEF